MNPAKNGFYFLGRNKGVKEALVLTGSPFGPFSPTTPWRPASPFRQEQESVASKCPIWSRRPLVYLLPV